MTNSVRDLVRDSGFPGMKVLEFAFDSRDSSSASDYLPHNYPENSVAYTGTHDNETLIGWYKTVAKEDQTLCREYLCDFYTPNKYLHKAMVAMVLRSKSKYAIIPIQDYMGLDNDCRINKPSTIGINWRWRLTEGQLTDELLSEVFNVTIRYGRTNWDVTDWEYAQKMMGRTPTR